MRGATAARPAQRQLHGLARLAFGCRVRRAFIEDHDDVRTELALHLHRLLGTEKHAVAVDRRGEGHALLVDLAQRAEAEHLETARVGQDRAVPVHEFMQAAMPADDVGARPQHEVEGVAEDDLRTGAAHLLRRHRLDRAVGADRHERRRLHAAAGKFQAAAAGGAVRGGDFKSHDSAAGSSGSPRALMNMASP